MLTVAVLSALAAGAAAHVTMYPSLANPESEYNKWVFRVPYGCEDVDPDGGPSTYYPMERMEAHVPKELVDSFVRVEWVSGWPAEMDMEDDGSAMVTWTGATPLPNHMGLDLGLIIFVPEQPEGVDAWDLPTTVYCTRPDGSATTREYFDEEAPRIEYGSECPSACKALHSPGGGYGDDYDHDR